MLYDWKKLPDNFKWSDGFFVMVSSSSVRDARPIITLLFTTSIPQSGNLPTELRWGFYPWFTLPWIQKIQRLQSIVKRLFRLLIGAIWSFYYYFCAKRFLLQTVHPQWSILSKLSLPSLKAFFKTLGCFVARTLNATAKNSMGADKILYSVIEKNVEPIKKAFSFFKTRKC